MSAVLIDGAPINYAKAPANLRGSLERYIEHRIAPGGFLTAFLSNDLMDALRRADEENKAQFHEIAVFLYNYTPIGCYGSPQRVADWLKGL